MQVASDYEQCHRLGEILTKRIGSVERIGKRVDRETDLLRFEIRRRADWILQRPALSGVVGLVEDSVGGADHRFAVAEHIPRGSGAGSKSGLLGGNQACRHARIAGIEKPSWSVGKHSGLRSGNKKIDLVVSLRGGEGQLVTKPQVQGHARCDLVGILAVSIQSSITDFASKVAAPLQENNRIAGQEVGKSV